MKSNPITKKPTVYKIVKQTTNPWHHEIIDLKGNSYGSYLLPEQARARAEELIAASKEAPKPQALAVEPVAINTAETKDKKIKENNSIGKGLEKK